MKMSSLLNFSPSSSSPSKTKRKICPICDKSFANGKAMGGHMRAHLAKLPLPPKSQPESEKSPMKMKSNSSTDHCLTDREVAMCLMKLTNDVWPNGVRPLIRFPLTRECKRRGELISYEQEDVEEEDEEEDISFSMTTMTRRRRCNYNKRRRSWGSRRRSNKRVKKMSSLEEEIEIDRSTGIRRVFKCPYCDKVFASGQALGGHKKVHLSYLEIGITSTSTSSDRNVPTMKNSAVFDLNLPAPLEN